MQTNRCSPTEEETKVLSEWSTASDGRRSERAKVVLLSAKGLLPDQVAAELGITLRTVYKWRERFLRSGVSGLKDRPRPGQPRRLPKEQRDEIVRVTTEELPPPGERWTIRSVAKRLGVTQHQVRKVWSEHGLQPHTGRSGIIDERKLEGHSLRLVGLFACPGLAVVALEACERGASSRLQKRVGPARSSPLRGFLEQTAGRGGVDAGAFGSFLRRLDQLRPHGPIHLSFSSSKAFKDGRVGALLAVHSSLAVSSKPCVSIWLDTLELWLAQSSRTEAGKGEMEPLTRALAEHFQHPSQSETLVWTRAVQARGSAGEQNVEACGSAGEQNVEARGSAGEQNVEARGSAGEQNLEAEARRPSVAVLAACGANL
jgi:transposase